MIIVPVFIPTAAVARHRHGAFRSGCRRQHHARTDHTSIRPSTLHHDQYRWCAAQDIVRDVLPFLYAMIAPWWSSLSVPETVLWLPRLFGYQGSAGEENIMNKPIYIINGPNLNRLGSASRRLRQDDARRSRGDVPGGGRRAPPSSSGNRTRSTRSSVGFTKRSTSGSAIIINPAGFTFTSIAILDALKMFPGPDHRIAYLKHSSPGGELSSFLCIDDCDGRHRWLGAARL